MIAPSDYCTELLIISVIAFQIYIGLCTYWIFKKIDRYENIAFKLIEKYLSHLWARQRADGIIARGNEVVNGEVVNGEIITTTNTVSTIDNIIVRERNQVIYYVSRAISYTPQQMQVPLTNVLNSWYGQLCIDLLSLCAGHNYARNN